MIPAITLSAQDFTQTADISLYRRCALQGGIVAAHRKDLACFVKSAERG